MQYAITDKRVLISRSGPFSKFTAINLNRLPEASLTESANGRGTILFGQSASFWARGHGDGFSNLTLSLDPSPRFIAIENARNVFEQI
ncbi:MAG: PH domain-containing protein [Methylocella sp.]